MFVTIGDSAAITVPLSEHKESRHLRKRIIART
jgi:hypothetical protein